MRQRNSACVIFPAIILFFSAAVSGQNAVIGIGSSPRAVADTNRVALAGLIQFNVNSGTTGTGTIVVNYGVPIAFAPDETLGTTAEVNVDLEAGTLAIQIPGGIGPGNSFILSGVRFDIPELGVDSLNAKISATPGSGFSFTAGTLDVTVISAVQPGLKVDTESDVLFTFRNPAATVTPLTLRILEGFTGAFNDLLESDETVPTRVKIRVEGLPEGARLNFPDTIPSPESGASLEALDDDELTLPTEDGALTITYEFNRSGTSDTRTESFNINYELEVETPPAEEATVFLQATLAPSNGANIPRYLERFVPAEEDLPFPEFTGVFPIRSVSDNFFGIAFTNTAEREIDVQLEAFDSDGDLLTGTGITNPASVSVEPASQISFVLQEVFGEGITSEEIATVVSRSRRFETQTLFLVGNTANTSLDGGVAGNPPLKSFVLPVLSREGNSHFTTIHLFNPSADSDVDVTLELRGRSGQVIETQEVTLEPQQSAIEEVESFFDVESSTFDGGYLLGSASGDGVVSFEIFGNTQAINVLAGQLRPRKKPVIRIPHAVAGPDFDTEVTLINTDATQSGVLFVSILDDGGSTLAGPVEISIAPREQRILDLSSLLGVSSGAISGSLQLRFKEVFRGPFLQMPSIAGAVRFRTAGGNLSASLPLFLAEDEEALYAHVAQDLGFFTGVAVMNPTNSEVSVTIEVFDRSGDLVGSTTVPLAPGGRMAKLLSELVTSTTGQLGGYFRVRTDEPVLSFALFGDVSGQALSAIPSQ